MKVVVEMTQTGHSVSRLFVCDEGDIPPGRWVCDDEVQLERGSMSYVAYNVVAGPFTDGYRVRTSRCEDHGKERRCVLVEKDGEESCYLLD